MAGTIAGHDDADIDLGQLFRAVWQRKGRILLATACVSALALVGSLMVSPSYQAESRLLIEPRAIAFSSADKTAVSDNQSLLDELNVVSQVQVLQSVELLKGVAQDLNLASYKEFTKQSTASMLTSAIGFGKKSTPEERVLDAFISKLNVFQVEKSRVIGIQFNAQDPALAAAVPNAMMQAYLAIQSGAKVDSQSEATVWLEPEIEKLRSRVAEAEKKVADYRAQNDLLPTSDSGNFAMRQLNDISGELAKVRADAASARSKADAVKAALATDSTTSSVPEVMASPMIQKLKESIAQTQSQISDLSTTLMDGHPRIKALKAQLADQKRQELDETRKVLASIENDARIAKLREAELLKQITSAKSDSAKAGQSAVGLAALEREAAAQRQLLETYLARYREAASKSNKNSAPADARIISQAVPPSEPHFPKIIPIVTVATLATLVFSSLIVMIAELFSGRALKPVARTEGLATPVHLAASVSSTSIAPSASPTQPAPQTASSSLLTRAKRPAKSGDPNAFSVANVARFLTENEARVIVVVLPEGQPETGSAVALGRTLAEAKQTAVLVDLSDNAVASRMTIPGLRASGITDLLAGNSSFVSAIHLDKSSTLHVVPQGHGDQDTALAGIDRLSMIIDALSESYDHVVLDCGAATPDSLTNLGSKHPVHVVLALPQPDVELLAKAAASFAECGFDDLILMSPQPLGEGGQRVAA